MRERTLQALWYAGALPDLETLDGLPVRVLDPGSWNRGSGPDFLGARLRIGDRTLEGHVEVHCDPADWERHGHDLDPAYAGLLLHLVVGPATGSVPRACARHTVRLDPALLEDDGADPGAGFPAPTPGLCRPIDRGRLDAELRSAGRRKVARRAERFHRDAAERGSPAALVAALAHGLGAPANGPRLERHVRAIPIAALDEACQSPGPWRDPTRTEALLFAGAGLSAPLGDGESVRYFTAVRILGVGPDPRGDGAGEGSADAGGADAADAAGRTPLPDGAESAGRAGCPGNAGGTRVPRPANGRRLATGSAATYETWVGARPAASPWRRLAGLAAILQAFGGPTLLAEEIDRHAGRWLDGAPAAPLLVRPGHGYWARRTRPGPATLPRALALIGSAQATTVERDVLLPWFLQASAGGNAADRERFWKRVDHLARTPDDGVLRFVAARLGVPARELFPTWMHQLGGRWLHRSACGGGIAACLACPLARAGGS